MQCPSCNSPLREGAAFCPTCGAQQQNPSAAVPGATPEGAASQQPNPTPEQAQAAGAAGTPMPDASAATNTQGTPLPTQATPYPESAAPQVASSPESATPQGAATQAMPAQPAPYPQGAAPQQANSYQGGYAPQGAPAAGMPAAGAAYPGAPVAPGAYGAPVMVKKRSKAPFIIGGVVLVLIIAVIVGFVSGFIPGLFNRGSVLTTLSSATEKVFTEATSAHAEVSIGYGSGSYGDEMSAEASWELGDDLRSSSFWFSTEDSYGDEVGFVFMDDKIISYEYYDGEIYYADIVMEDCVDYLNEYVNDELGTSVDFNGIIRGGHFDRDYIEKLNATLNDTDLEDLDYYSSYLEDVDSEGIAKITNDFVNSECSKDSVYEKFILNLKESNSGGEKTFNFDLDILKFLEAFADYAHDVASSNNDLYDAGKLLDTTIDQALNLIEYYDLDPIEIRFSVAGNILSRLNVDFSMSDYTYSLDLKLTDVNNVSLSNNDELLDILDEAQ